MNQGGISDKLLGFADAIVGHLSGGLAYANVLASMVFAGISGTALADTVSLGGIEIPMMAKQGYDVPFSVAVTAASSCMGPIIPPSVPMIIAATMTGLSVSKMFMAGIVPGILMGGGMCFVCWYESKKHNYPKRDRMSTFKEIVHEGKEAIWAIIMVAIILFGIMGGVMTPTEASIVCIAYGTIVSFVVYRKLNLKSFYLCLKTTLSSSAAIMALVAFANVFAYILTKERIPNMIADAMLGLTSNKYIILLLINLFLIFVGMFMETIAAILILFPVLLQLATAVGVDPVQFGISHISIAEHEQWDVFAVLRLQLAHLGIFLVKVYRLATEIAVIVRNRLVVRIEPFHADDPSPIVLIFFLAGPSVIVQHPVSIFVQTEDQLAAILEILVPFSENAA